MHDRQSYRLSLLLSLLLALAVFVDADLIKVRNIITSTANF